MSPSSVREVLKRVLRQQLEEWRLPREARLERGRDHSGPPPQDPGIAAVISASLDWLVKAQDNSANADGGVARHYSLISGWGSSYPETTGYIVPTIIEQARLRNDEGLMACAKRMLDWLTDIQFPDGGFQGGTIGADPLVPVIFNTGQILLGLAAGVAEFGDKYKPAMEKAADWLTSVQDSDGCWRKHPTPFAEAGEKSYETHVAWGLFEAARITGNESWSNAGLAQVSWAVSHQQQNGWMAKCCLTDPSQPLTHTLGYALRGILEAWCFSGDGEFLEAAKKLGRNLAGGVCSDGRLPGCWLSNWQPAVDWDCLTGSAQLAYCWLMLFEETGEEFYRDVAFQVNQFVRRTVATDGPSETRGGVKGSFPVDAPYGRYEYLNWAAKFFIDANQFEAKIRRATEPRIA